MSSSKRPSTMPAVPKPPTSLASTLVIPDNASLTGTHLITLGSNTIVHPRAKINSAFAPVKIGSNCIISERCLIGFQSTPVENERGGVVIENGVIVEVGAMVEGKMIGEGCVIEVNAQIGNGAVVGKHCKIGPMCKVAEGEVVPDFTVIYGNGLRRIDTSGIENLKLKMVGRQIDVLRKLIPTNLSKFQ